MRSIFIKTTQIISVSLIVILICCTGNDGTEIAFGIDACASCGMVIDQPNEAAGIIVQEEFTAFCNPICMIQEVNRLKNAGIKTDRRFVSNYQLGKLIDADQAIFFVGNIPSVMNFGVVTFGNNENALDISSKYPGDILDHTSFRKRFENSDRIVSLSLISSAMEPDKIVAEKNEIFEFIINATDITGLFIIRGYEEQTSIQIRQDGPTKLKLITTKPGAGFPVYIGDYENPVGQLVVTGSHTVEEAL
jgi:hypothetical protein